MPAEQTFSIKEAAEMTGLATSALRYYEQVGISPPITRDPSSGHRVYTSSDVELLGWIACMAATGMGIAELREYATNGKRAPTSAAEQIDLLKRHDAALGEEMKKLRLRRRYLAIKIHYWQAVDAGDTEGAATLARQALEVARQMR